MFKELKNIKEDEASLKKFGYTLGIFLFVIMTIQYILTKNIFILLWLGPVLLIITFVEPRWLKPFNKAWFALAFVLNWFTTRVILILLFYVILTPLSILSKLFGKRYFPMAFDKNINTYWEIREKTSFSKESYEKQF